MAGLDLLESLIQKVAENSNESSRLSVVRLGDSPLRGWEPFRGAGDLVINPAPARTIRETVAQAEQSLASWTTLALAPFTRLAASNCFQDSDARLSSSASVIEHVLARTSVPGPRARLLTVTPASVLEGAVSHQFREVMGETWRLSVAVFVHIDSSEVGSSFKLAVSAWTGLVELESPTLTRFMEVPRMGADTDLVLNDLSRILGRNGGQTRFGYIRRRLVSPDASHGFKANSPEDESQINEFLQFGPISMLTDLFTILKGRNYLQDSEVSAGPPREGMLRVIGGRDVLQDGSLADSDNEARWVFANDGIPRLKQGDLVFRGLLGPSQRTLVFAHYSSTDGPATPGPTTVAIRPRKEATVEAVSIALAYLGSQHCKTVHDMTASSIGGSVRLNPEGIRVPQPDAALLMAVKEIQEAARRFESWRALAQDVLSNAFDERSLKDAYVHVVESGRTLRLRAEAATSISDFSTIVRTRFPLPLSYRWRTVEANLSVDSSSETYVEILEAAEVLLCFLAQVSLAAARELGKSVGAAGSVSEKLSSMRSGPGFGDWLTVLAEIANSRTFRSEVPEQHILRQLQGVLSGEGVEEAVRSIKSRRDAFAHMRRPTGTELAKAAQEAFGDLRMLFEAATFLSETPLVAIDSTTWDSLDRVSNARARSLVGDHPVVRTYTLVTEAPLDSGSLYLGTQTGLILLRPFLIGRDCPDCGHWSTFHADRFDGENVQFKSLERGHVTVDNSQVSALQSSGLLVKRVGGSSADRSP